MKVLLRLKTRQIMDGEEDGFSVSNKAILLSRGDSFLLSYFQENVHHSLEFFPKEKRVVMMRNWKDKQRVEYHPGLRWSVDYETELCRFPSIHALWNFYMKNFLRAGQRYDYPICFINSSNWWRIRNSPLQFSR